MTMQTIFYHFPNAKIKFVTEIINAKLIKVRDSN